MMPSVLIWPMRPAPATQTPFRVSTGRNGGVTASVGSLSGITTALSDIDMFVDVTIGVALSKDTPAGLRLETIRAACILLCWVLV